MKAHIITDRQQWNSFIASSVCCNVTQTYEWGELLARNDREMLPIGVINDEGQLCAAMLIIVSKLSLLKLPYLYAPRGPVIDDPDTDAMDILLEYVQAEATKRHAFMLKIEPSVLDANEQWLIALKKRGFCSNPEHNHLRHEWVLDLRPDEKTLMAEMKKTWRYCIRLAGRKEVKIRAGETSAELDIFYQLLQTTSNRDTFFIYGKDFYERLLALYGKRARLFIAEYAGEPLGAALLITHGRWCWYMYGASSNRHRDCMPNHLLQWTAFQWAKQQGCWYYNFRGIPETLEEAQPMWGVYVFKSGFGGHAMRSLETHDLAYNPLIYQIYRLLADVRLKYANQKAQKQALITEQKKDEIQQVQQTSQNVDKNSSNPVVLVSNLAAETEGVEEQIVEQPLLQTADTRSARHK